ncbi:MAG: hypothetical protein JRN10_06980, partial [Nitrososphaerota archaeon]|nr:hypothetical protein [Nitrososphaerota archaeon]
NTVKYSELEERLSGFDHRELRDGNSIKIIIQLPMAESRFGDHHELEITMNLAGNEAEITGVFIVSGNSVKEAGYDLIADWLGLQ